MVKVVLHILLSIWVILSTSGVILNKHFCGNELQKLTLFVEAEECHQEAATDLCPLHRASTHTDSDQQEDNGCCEDQTDLLKLDKVNTSEFLNVYSIIKLKLEALELLTIILNVPKPLFSPSHLQYKPPRLVCNLSVRLQTFLL